ncbi:MAG: electron transfer flavoprotein subunit alpha/FixB family protein [Desulfohalobiaceae bacterium]|nr:electron transfer flavoprotein subunit alpha/FixB family protein [Desulfohalobiaceae bacterium]
MSRQVFAYIKHSAGEVEDSAYELIKVAEQIDPQAEVTALLFGTGDELDKACQQAASIYPQVWKVDKQEHSYPNAELIRPQMMNLLPADAVVLASFDTFGMDLTPGLSVKMGSSHLADIVGVEGMEGDTLKAVRQEHGGQVHTHVTCDMSSGAILSVRGGVFPASEGGQSGQVVDKTAEAGDVQARRKFLEVREAEIGEVDITKEDILISIGRGIEEEENIEIAQELAEAAGGVVSCSRPVVDAKWMDKSRQVGTSGKTVKPKIYLAMGISGSFQHMGGVKGNPFIVAVNKNSKAPIFQVAHVGVVEDLLEFAPTLTEKIQEMK